MKRLTVLMLALAACAPSERDAVVIENVAIVNPESGTLDSGRTVLVRAGRIEFVGAPADIHPPRGAQRVDGTGQFLMPGLWDMHVHLEDEDLPKLVSWGVTGVRDMGSSFEEIASWRGRMADSGVVGPRIVASGPMLAGSPPWQPGNDKWILRSPADAQRLVDSLARGGAQLIKIHDGISRSAMMAILRAARGRNLMVAGHLPAGANPVDAARAGFTGIEHLEFVPKACAGLFQRAGEDSPDRAPLPLECAAEHLDSLMAQLGRAGVWLDPTVSMLRIWVERHNYPPILSGVRDLVGPWRRHNVRLLTGTDLGDDRIEAGESLHDEMTLLVEAGFTPAEVLRAATVNPARLLGLADSLGTVAVGKAADLVLLEANPLEDIRATRRIVLVIRNGRVIRPS